MARVLLGRDQSISLNGQAIEGVRDFDVSFAGREFDVTNWSHSWTSSVVLFSSATLKLLIYWQDNYVAFAELFNKHPVNEQRVNLAVAGLFSGPFVVTDVQVKSPINGNVAWEVTLKPMVYA